VWVQALEDLGCGCRRWSIWGVGVGVGGRYGNNLNAIGILSVSIRISRSAKLFVLDYEFPLVIAPAVPFVGRIPTIKGVIPCASVADNDSTAVAISRISRR
jgi:hypothetical protein